MDRLVSTLLNFATNFLVAFVVVALLRDRSAGLKAGVVFGVVGAVGTLLLYDRVGDEGDGEGTTLDDLAVDPTA
jgi:hypothetical protein